MSYLGDLAGNEWSQYSNYTGQIYYICRSTGVHDYTTRIPAGFEDQPQDVWNYDADRGQWINARTGRITFQDPNPPPPQTYLDLIVMRAHLKAIERAPEPSEALYRRVVGTILSWFFEAEEGYSVAFEDSRYESGPDRISFKVEYITVNPLHTHDVMIVVCKRAGESWDLAEDQCQRHCEKTGNESGQIYGMIQLGMEIKFYQWANSTLAPLGHRFHIRNDVQDITEWVNHLKAHPLRAA